MSGHFVLSMLAESFELQLHRVLNPSEHAHGMALLDELKFWPSAIRGRCVDYGLCSSSATGRAFARGDSGGRWGR